MSRSITAAVQTAINAETCTFCVFVELDFISGFVRLCNANITLSWDSKSWIGIGDLGTINAISEAPDLEAKGITLTLSGIPNTAITTSLTEYYQGRSCKVWISPLDSNQQVIANPVLVFHGRMDNMQIELGENAIITVSAESRLADWDRPRVRRFNHQDQITEYAGDLGFEYVEQMVEKEIIWGG
jgi:hypothetical protein